MQAKTNSTKALPSLRSCTEVALSRKSTVRGRWSRVRLAACPLGHLQVIRFCQRMRHDEGHTLRSQDHREGLRALPLNRVECDIRKPGVRDRTQQVAKVFIIIVSLNI